MRTHLTAVVRLGFLGGSPAGALASQSDEPSDSPEDFSAIPAFSTDHILKRGDWLVGYACSRIVLFALLLGLSPVHLLPHSRLAAIKSIDSKPRTF